MVIIVYGLLVWKFINFEHTEHPHFSGQGKLRSPNQVTASTHCVHNNAETEKDKKLSTWSQDIQKKVQSQAENRKIPD